MEARPARGLTAAPAADPWTLAVHDAPAGFAPLGTAVAIGPRLALTCAHVVAGDEPHWVSFPKVTAAWKQRRRVLRVDRDPDDPHIADVALLHLDEDLPPGVEPARLRLLEPGDLTRRAWWAFGFPQSSRTNGNEATGVVGARLAHGWVRLDTDSPYPVEPGFSGGGLWLPDYDAVAAIVGRALVDGDRRGDAQALTLAQADVFLPDARLRVVAGWAAADAGPSAMTAWGWRLDTDPEAGRHWRPRGRGVMSEHEPGYRFAGRTAALRRIVDWLDRPAADQRVLVVTGSPGVGKSAVLGRIVTTADAALRAGLPAGDDGVKATVGSVGCAVHVKGRTALDVAGEIARAVGVALPERVDELPGRVRDRLTATFNLVLDAVDEAASPAEARRILAGVALPLALVGVRVVCGTRRADADGDLLGALAGAAVEIDLDDPDFFDLADLVRYTLASLQLLGAERPDSPYADDAVARPVAARIAGLAGRNFLIAGLEARRRGLYDDVAADPAHVTLTATVDATLRAYLDRIPPVDGVPAWDVLAALAYAEAPGWSTRLWHTATVALGFAVAEPQLDRFARTAAASFLIESGSAFRLFHQALNEALTRPRGPGGERADEGRLTVAFLASGRACADPYLLRSLPGHADRAGLIDLVLADDEYLLHADLSRVLGPANHARTEPGRQRARLLHLTLPAVSAPPAERAAMFSVTQAVEQLPPLAPDAAAPYRARWAIARPRTELRRLTGHTDWVTAACSAGGLLATGSMDGSVRIWDPATGAVLHRLDDPGFRAMCMARVGGQARLATAGRHGVRVWDPATGSPVAALVTQPAEMTAICPAGALLAVGGSDGAVLLWDPLADAAPRRLAGHTGEVTAVASVSPAGRPLLVSAGTEGTVRVWDLATGTSTAHTAPAGAMCAFGDALLAIASDTDKTVTIWDPAARTEVTRFTGHMRGMRAICAIDVDGRTLVATGSDDKTVRIWDPDTGTERHRFTGHTDWVRAICPVRVEGRPLLATGGDDNSVRIWDPSAGGGHEPAAAPATRVSSVCLIGVGGRALLATGSTDNHARLWDPRTGTELLRFTGHTNGIHAVCPVGAGGRTLLVTGSFDGSARVWDARTGAELHHLTGHARGVTAVCTIDLDLRTIRAVAGDHGPRDAPLAAPGGDVADLRRLVVTASTDDTVRLWDPTTGAAVSRLDARLDGVHAMCTVPLDGRVLLAIGGSETVRVLDPATGEDVHRLAGHTGGVFAMCTVTSGGRTLLACGADDRTVRIWDPATGTELHRLTGFGAWVNTVCAVRTAGRSLLATGSDDGTVRLWDPGTGRLALTIPVHNRAMACCAVGPALAIALDFGFLVVDLSL